MTIATARAEIEARAKVTERMRPLRIDGQIVHQVALPWHWGYGGAVAGRQRQRPRSRSSGDPNVSIQEAKAFTCNVRAGRRDGRATAQARRRPRADAERRARRRTHPSEDAAHA